MDLLKILKQFNVEESNISELKEAITKEIGTDFIPKSQYNKKVTQLDSLQEKVNDYEALKDKPNEFKEKYEQLTAEYEKYKADIENEKIKNEKLTLVKEGLKGAGVTKEKLVSLLCNEVNIDELEVEEGKIKNWDNVLSPIKENYSDFFTSTETIGGNTEPATPPISSPTTITREQLNSMSTEEINKNWDSVSKLLSQK